MALRNDPNGPWSIEGTTGIDAEADREMLKSLLVAALGLTQFSVNPGDLLITASNTPDNNLHMAPGQCFILGTQGANQGAYHSSNDATDVPIPTIPGVAGGIRRDLVGIQIEDSQYGTTGNNDQKVFYVTGTVGSSNDPTPPVNSIILARISWPAVNSSIVTPGMITDLRPLGAWTTYTPTWTTDSGTPNMGSTGVLLGKYKLIGKTCTFRIYFTANGSGFNGGVGKYKFALPFTAAAQEQVVTATLVSTTPSPSQRVNGTGYIPSASLVVYPVLPTCPVAFSGQAVNMVDTFLNQNTPAASGSPIFNPSGAVTQPFNSSSWLVIEGSYEIA